MTSRGESIASLQLGRAIAAFIVVMHHSEQAANAFTVGPDLDLFGWGIHGVDFFFVLSGFIIYHVHSRDPRGIDPARRYALKRLVGIYVPYLPIGIGMVVLYSMFPGLSASERQWGLLTSFTLLPSSLPPALSVAWTLVFEILFYGVFLAYYLTRYFSSVIAFWFVAILASQALGIDHDFAVLAHLLDPIVLEFILGMLAAKIAQGVGPRTGIAFLLSAFLGIALFIAVRSAGIDPHRAWLGVPLAGLTVALVAMERAGWFRPDAQSVLFLGAASYSIYLIHNPVASVVARGLSSGNSWILSFSGCILAGVLGGCLYHILWERPLLNRLRQALLRSNTTSSELNS